MLAAQSWALSPTVAKLVEYETKANAVSTRSNEPFKIENYEIPTRLLQMDVADRLSPKIRKTLIFKKNGQEYIRWIINPEDTLWYKDVEKFLKANQISAKRHHYFTGYMTASRSYIVESPNGVQFSAKVSTNRTGGNWMDKKQTWDDAKQVRMAADFVDGELRKNPMQNAVVMDEPAGFGIEDIDQAMLIRDLGNLPQGTNYYLPGFSAVFETTGKEIAAENGSNLPQVFWNHNYNRPLARALAEFAARTGLTFDSPHSQNFLIELDQNMKPTGRIVIRDFGDSYALKEWFVAKGKTDFLANWEDDNILSGNLHVSIGILHGNTFPTWMNDTQYNVWGNDFYGAFEDEYSSETGIPKKQLAEELSRSGRYFSKDYPDYTPGWKRFLRSLTSGDSVCESQLIKETQ